MEANDNELMGIFKSAAKPIEDARIEQAHQPNLAKLVELIHDTFTADPAFVFSALSSTKLDIRSKINNQLIQIESTSDNKFAVYDSKDGTTFNLSAEDTMKALGEFYGRGKTIEVSTAPAPKEKYYRPFRFPPGGIPF